MASKSTKKGTKYKFLLPGIAGTYVCIPQGVGAKRRILFASKTKGITSKGFDNGPDWFETWSQHYTEDKLYLKVKNALEYKDANVRKEKRKDWTDCEKHSAEDREFVITKWAECIVQCETWMNLKGKNRDKSTNKKRGRPKVKPPKKSKSISAASNSPSPVRQSQSVPARPSPNKQSRSRASVRAAPSPALSVIGRFSVEPESPSDSDNVGSDPSLSDSIGGQHVDQVHESLK